MKRIFELQTPNHHFKNNPFFHADLIPVTKISENRVLKVGVGAGTQNIVCG